MRWLALAILLAARSASAIVIMEPPLVRACRESASWPALDACMTKHGFHMQLLRHVGRARLIRVDEPNGEGGRVELGYAMYVEDKGRWRLGGLFETGTPGFEFLAFETVTVHKVTGFRFDLGFIGPTTVSTDGEVSAPARIIMKRSVYCQGESWPCTEVTVMCDVLVGGSTYYSYRGTISVDDQAKVRNAGAREVAGSCEPPKEQFLGWSVR